MKKKDLTGKPFGRLVALCEDGRTKSGSVKWKCRCECGNYTSVSEHDLSTGNTTSCGCLKRDNSTKHGLYLEHKKLYKSVFNHFDAISKQLSGYAGWVLDKRYSNDADGVVKFCNDLIALYPEECSRYEKIKTLDLDKDNGGNVFKPECIVFRDRSENRSKAKNNLLIDGNTRLVDFCRCIGKRTMDCGKMSKDYAKYQQWFRKHNGEAHPEIVKAANQTILEMRQCLELLSLLDDVRSFKSQYLTL